MCFCETNPPVNYQICKYLGGRLSESGRVPEGLEVKDRCITEEPLALILCLDRRGDLGTTTKNAGGRLLRKGASSVAKAMEDETKAKLPAPLQIQKQAGRLFNTEWREVR